MKKVLGILLVVVALAAATTASWKPWGSAETNSLKLSGDVTINSWKPWGDENK
jgi:hypothetical protein